MPAPAQAGRITLPLALQSGTTAAQLTVPLSGPSGRVYEVSFFRFYLSRLALIDASGTEYPAALLAPDGSPQPYGVALVAIDDPATHTLRLAATPGGYVGLKLGVGLAPACHQLNPMLQSAPLANESGLTWDWAGYLHLRFEGQVRQAPSAAPLFALYHLFQAEAFTQVVVPGKIEVGGAAANPSLVLDLDRMLERAALTTPSAHGADGWLMDNLASHQAFELR